MEATREMAALLDRFAPDSDEHRFLLSLTPLEQTALLIAQRQLHSSFSVGHLNAFVTWRAAQAHWRAMFDTARAYTLEHDAVPEHQGDEPVFQETNKLADWFNTQLSAFASTPQLSQGMLRDPVLHALWANTHVFHVT